MFSLLPSVPSSTFLSYQPTRRTRRAGTPAGGLHCPFGKRVRALGKRASHLSLSLGSHLCLLPSYFLILPAPRFLLCLPPETYTEGLNSKKLFARGTEKTAAQETSPPFSPLISELPTPT